MSRFNDAHQWATSAHSHEYDFTDGIQYAIISRQKVAIQDETSSSGTGLDGKTSSVRIRPSYSVYRTLSRIQSFDSIMITTAMALAGNIMRDIDALLL